MLRSNALRICEVYSSLQKQPEKSVTNIYIDTSLHGIRLPNQAIWTLTVKPEDIRAETLGQWRAGLVLTNGVS